VISLPLLLRSLHCPVFSWACWRTSRLGWLRDSDLMHMYVPNRTIVFYTSPSPAKVYIFHRGISWDWHRHLSRSARRRFHGRVRNSTLWAWRKLFKPSGQMDFRCFILTRSSSMACPYHATVSRPRRRSWHRPFHRVICLPSFFSFLVA
jgi:hypothetical protein